MAPPLTKINWDDLDKLCAIQCTLEEIASFFDCSADTIERAVKREKNMRFAEYYTQKSKKGHISLRRKMFQTAVDGNVTMMIFLSKQWLGYSDKVEQKNQVTGGVDLQIVIPDNGRTKK